MSDEVADLTAAAQPAETGLDSAETHQADSQGAGQDGKPSRRDRRIEQLVGLLKDERRQNGELKTQMSEFVNRITQAFEKKEKSVTDFSPEERRRIVQNIVTSDDPAVKQHAGSLYDIVADEARRAAEAKATEVLKSQSEREQKANELYRVNQRILSVFPQAQDANGELHQLAEAEYAKLEGEKGKGIGERDPEYYYIAHERAYQRLVAGDSPFPTFVSKLLNERQRLGVQTGVEGNSRPGPAQQNETRRAIEKGDTRGAAVAHVKQLLGKKG